MHGLLMLYSLGEVKKNAESNNFELWGVVLLHLAVNLLGYQLQIFAEYGKQ